MAEQEPNIEREAGPLDVTGEFLEMTDSKFHEFLAEKQQHLQIDLDISDVVASTAKQNSLKHFLLEGETRKLMVRATAEETEHFKTLFPPNTEWQIITRE